MIPTWGTSTGRNSAGGPPSLSLDFSNQSYLLNGTAYNAFGASPGITFSRGTNASVIDSTGKLTYAPSNMLSNSEGFGAAAWSKFSATVSSNVVAAPDATITADKLVEDATTAGHFVQQSITYVSTITYSYSVYAKAAEKQYIQLIFPSAAFGSVLTAGFQLSGNGSTVVSAGATSLITAVGNGWYRCSVTATSTVTASSNAQIRIAASLSTAPASYAGAVTDGVYIWGAQLGAVTYETAPRPYNGTTPKNLLGYTEELNNAAWVKTLTTVTANSIADPNGNLNADTISATVGGGTVLQTLTLLAIPYTFSIWLKRKTGIGAVSITVDGVTYSTQTITTDWARYSTTLTPAAGSKTIGVKLATLGDEVYAWGAQLSDSASLDTYVYNPAAAFASAAYYGPRFDYDPTTLAPLGLLIEEARTNLLLNSATLSTQNVTTTAQAYTLSFYGTGTVTLSGTSTAGPLVGTGVFPNRVSLTFTPTAGTLTLTVSGTVSNAQLEAGGFATSYIFTAGASVTRSADVATMVGNNFTNWYNQTTGTFAASFNASANANATYMSASNGSIVQNSIHIDNDSGNMRAVYYSGSAEVAALVLGAIGTAGTANKIATAYAVNDFAASRNGGTVVTDSAGALPVSLTQLNIGVDDRLSAIYYTSNHIKSISYYNTRLTNAQLQAVSA